jgi:hypothetical protein
VAGGVGNLRRVTSSGVGGDGHGVGHSKDGLDVEVGLFVLSSGQLSGAGAVVLLWAAVNADEFVLVGSLYGLGLVLLQEERGVWPDGDFGEAGSVSVCAGAIVVWDCLQVVETDLVLSVCLLLVVADLVQSLDCVSISSHISSRWRFCSQGLAYSTPGSFH